MALLARPLQVTHRRWTLIESSATLIDLNAIISTIRPQGVMHEVTEGDVA